MDNSTPQSRYSAQTAKTVIRNLKKRNMDGHYCSDSEQARQLILSLIPPRTTVSWGGSQTLIDTGILESLIDGDYSILDRDSASDHEEKARIERLSFSADFFLMSTNAVTRDGELVNIDGKGNRVAALIFGPEKVLVVVGMNKVSENLDTALSRVRNLAAPLNVQRLNRKTPCAESGFCEDCHSPGCVCSHTVITRHSLEQGRITVILVGETLGF